MITNQVHCAKCARLIPDQSFTVEQKEQVKTDKKRSGNVYAVHTIKDINSGISLGDALLLLTHLCIDNHCAGCDLQVSTLDANCKGCGHSIIHW